MTGEKYMYFKETIDTIYDASFEKANKEITYGLYEFNDYDQVYEDDYDFETDVNPDEDICYQELLKLVDEGKHIYIEFPEEQTYFLIAIKREDIYKYNLDTYFKLNEDFMNTIIKNNIDMKFVNVVTGTKPATEEGYTHYKVFSNEELDNPQNADEELLKEFLEDIKNEKLKKLIAKYFNLDI